MVNQHAVHAAVLGLQVSGLILAILLLATCLLGRLRRHPMVPVFWISVIVADLNSLLPAFMHATHLFDDVNQKACGVQALLSAYFWTVVPAFALPLTFELARIVRSVIRQNSWEVATATSSTREKACSIGIEISPFILASPALGLAIKSVYESQHVKLGFAGCQLTDTDVQLAISITLIVTLSTSLALCVYALASVLRLHLQTLTLSRASTTDWAFFVRMSMLAGLAASGCALTVTVDFIFAESDLRWVLTMYNVAFPVAASLVLAGADVLVVWKAWILVRPHRSESQLKHLLSTTTSTQSYQGPKRIQPRDARVVSMQSLDSDYTLPKTRSKPPPLQETRSARASKSPYRASMATASIFGVPSPSPATPRFSRRVRGMSRRSRGLSDLSVYSKESAQLNTPYGYSGSFAVQMVEHHPAAPATSLYNPDYLESLKDCQPSYPPTIVARD